MNVKRMKQVIGDGLLVIGEIKRLKIKAVDGYPAMVGQIGSFFCLSRFFTHFL